MFLFNFSFFIVYKENWSIVKVAEWLFFINDGQYTVTYRKNDDSGSYETSDDIEIAGDYILRKIVDSGFMNILV